MNRAEDVLRARFVVLDVLSPPPSISARLSVGFLVIKLHAAAEGDDRRQQRLVVVLGEGFVARRLDDAQLLVNPVEAVVNRLAAAESGWPCCRSSHTTSVLRSSSESRISCVMRSIAPSAPVVPSPAAPFTARFWL